MANGRSAGAVLVWHDVTEREEILARLATEQARLQAIIQNAPEAIVVADREARILFTNPAADRLYARPVPLNQEFGSHVKLQLCHPDGAPYDPRDLPLTRSALDGETLSGVEMSIIQPDGQRRELLVSSAPIRGGRGTRSAAP